MNFSTALKKTISTWNVPTWINKLSKRGFSVHCICRAILAISKSYVPARVTCLDGFILPLLTEDILNQQRMIHLFFYY